MQATKRFKSEYFRDVNAMFQFEDWMIGQGDGWYGLAAAFQFAGIKDDECVRLSAADQRKLFGRVVFGKKAVRISSANGTFETARTVSFGGDFDTEYHYPSHYYVQDGVWLRRTDLVW